MESTSGMPARTSVASWRVMTATSAAAMRRKYLSRSMSRVDLDFAASSVARVSMMPSRRRAVRNTLAFSASRTPRTDLPDEARTPRNSKTAMALLHRDVFLGGRQNFLDRGELQQNLASAVVAQRVHALVD